MARFVLLLLAVFALVYSGAALPAALHQVPYNGSIPAFPTKRSTGDFPKLQFRAVNHTDFVVKRQGFYNSTEVLDKRQFNTTEPWYAAQRRARDFPSARTPIRDTLDGAA